MEGAEAALQTHLAGLSAGGTGTAGREEERQQRHRRLSPGRAEEQPEGGGDMWPRARTTKSGPK